MKPSWVVFDVGGVLLDWRTSATNVAEMMGITRNKLFDALFDQAVDMNIGNQMNLGRISTHNGWTDILKRLEQDYTPREVIARWHAEEFWFKDTLTLLHDLKTAGYKLAIMSNSWLRLADPESQTILPKDLQLFDRIFDSSQEGLVKPDEAFYALVEKNTEAHAGDLLFIDDDEKNIHTAKRRRWQTYLYNADDDYGAKANAALRAKLL